MASAFHSESSSWRPRTTLRDHREAAAWKEDAFRHLLAMRTLFQVPGLSTAEVAQLSLKRNGFRAEILLAS